MSWLFVASVAMASMGGFFHSFQDQTKTPQQNRDGHRRQRQPLVFLLSYFVDNGESGVYLATSDDGFHFKPLLEPNVPILKSELGDNQLTRDPCITFGPDRQWHMVWTTGWWKRTIGMAHSRDLVHWTQQFVPAMIDVPNSLNAWAPEINYDQKTQKYIIYWSSTIKGRFSATASQDGDLGPDNEPLNHRFYFTTTSDFKTFSPSRLLWDPGFSCIDATMHWSRDGWLLFGKNETRVPSPAKYLFYAMAPNPTGPFHMVNPRITGEYWAEGPTSVRLQGKLRVYFDRYTEGTWGAVETSDMKTWTDISDKIQMVPGARHGTIVIVPKSFADRTREALRNRQKTAGNQSNFVRN